MSIFRFNPSDLGTPGVGGGDIAKAFMGSYFAARQDMRAEQGMQNENTRLGMQQQELNMRLEDQRYHNEVLRPLELQGKQLGLASAGLQIASQSLGLQQQQQQMQVNTMRIGQEMKTNTMLDSTFEWLNGQANGAGDAVPVTSFSQGGAVGGPDEMQDSWTNRGYSASGKNLTKGIVAVNPSKYPLGTVFRDEGTGEVFLAGDKHGNDDPNVVDIYMPPGEYKPIKENRNLKVIGNIGKVPDTPEGVQAVLANFRQGTGVPSRAEAVAPVTATGMPIVAAAAGSLNPTAVITQAFGPQQQQALNIYNQLSVVAQTGQPYQRQKALLGMQAMDSDPRFIQAKAQFQEMTTAVQNQVQLNGLLQSTPPVTVEAFQTIWGDRYKLEVQPDGQYLPMNAKTGLPLNSQEQAAFATAFRTHTQTFDPVAASKQQQAAVMLTNPLISTILRAKALPVPQPPQAPVDAEGKPVDAESPEYKTVYAQRLKEYESRKRDWDKAQADAIGAQGELLNLAQNNTYVAPIYSKMFPPQAAQPAASAPTAPAAPTAKPAPKTIEAAATVEQRKAADATATADAAKWTDAKQTLAKEITEKAPEFADTGKDTAEENPAIQLAAKIMREHDRNKFSLPTGNEPESTAEKVFKKLGRKYHETVFEQARTGSNKVPNWEVLQAWAEDTLRKYGYLEGGQGAAQPAAATEELPVVATPEEAAKLPKGTKFKDPNGNIRVAA
jgi:3D (Asp-Asp-Asp) domain-containing protein